MNATLAVNEEQQPGWAGSQLRSTLLVLLIPTLLAALIIGFGLQLPKWALYGAGGAIALVVGVRAFWDPEWLLALFLFYLPVSRVFPAAIAPLVNGTSLLFAGLFVAWFCVAHRRKREITPTRGIVRLVGLFLCLTALTIIPTVASIGWEQTRDYSFEKYENWLEQLATFFIVVGMIRDGRMARRVAVYLMIATVAALLFGVQEMLSKSAASSIEKSRVFGPQYQPNEFGAFIVSNLMIVIALAACWFPRARALWFVPTLLLGAKILAATFSRGAVLGLVAGGALIAFMRGRGFFLALAAAAVLIFAVFPTMLPQSVLDRFAETNVQDSEGERLDKSSADRLILWQAALQMTTESPLLGKGFGMFPQLKDRYTSTPVPVSDPHNMYLFICAQMGVPALLLYLAILLRMFGGGLKVYRRLADPLGRSIGIGCAGMVFSWLIMNLFGSRMTAVETSGFFWVYLAVLACLEGEVAATAMRSVPVRVSAVRA